MTHNEKIELAIKSVKSKSYYGWDASVELLESLKISKSQQQLECEYAKKWDEIWDGDKNTEAYKKLKKIVEGGAKRKRVDYGEFWKTERGK